VAVTTGLLSRLNRDELQGVIAHEIGHISNLDCRFMVLAGVVVGAIVLLSDMFLRGLRHARFGGRSSRGGGQAQLILFIVAIVLAILAPIFARLMYFACSRKREYLADASSARFTRYPEGLASALEKVETAAVGAADVNRVVAPMYIVNPLQARGAFGLMSTHPSTGDRIRILRSMAGGVSYAQYEKAYREIRKGAGILGASALTDQADVAVRPPSAENEPLMAERRREAMDTVHRLNGYRFAQCACGTRMKLPPVYKETEITCPSCGKSVTVPADGETQLPPPDEPVQVRLEDSATWRAIQCPCGAKIPISPTFSGKRMRCRKCGRQIEIE
jgi:heat shock protein HtpX